MSSTKTSVLAAESVAEFLPRVENVELQSGNALQGARVTVVFPCLNEELAGGQCVTESLEVMRRAGIDGSVLVIDNGSTDQSVTHAINAGAQVIVQREPGYGAALRSGFEAAQSEFVIMADADGTYELEAIPRLLLPLLEGNADLVLGQRLNDATTATMPWLHRYVGTPAITFLVKRATKKKLSLRDSQSGFRAFRRDDILKLNLSSTGMEFASEMLIRSAWANLRIHEVDTKYAERIGESKLNTFSDGLRHLRQILLLSPESVVSIPGIVATLFAYLVWILAAGSGRSIDTVGSLAWSMVSVADVLSILGPLVFCTGIVLRYRAESNGLSSSHVKVPLSGLIRRFFYIGIAAVSTSLLGFGALVISAHLHPGFISHASSISISSFLRSSLVIGIMLSAAPLIAPFLTSSPRPQLPVAEERHLEMTFEFD